MNNGSGKTGSFEKYKRSLSNVLVAPPLPSKIEKSKLVLNDEDAIRLVNPLASPSFLNFSDPTAIRDLRIGGDRFLDHGMLQTYLNVHNISSLSDDFTSLPELREFTLQSIVDAAGLLESNCPVASINHTINSNEVSFNASSIQNHNLNGLVYRWDFGDQTQIVENLSPTIAHKYKRPGTYVVKLTVTDYMGTDFGSLSKMSQQVTLEDERVYNPLCMEYGKYHLNFDGSKGGFVSEDAIIESSVYLDHRVSLCKLTEVRGESWLVMGEEGVGSKISDARLNNVVINASWLIDVYASEISDVVIETGNVAVRYSTISSSNFDSFTLSVHDSYVIDSTVATTPDPYWEEEDSIAIYNSSFINFNRFTDYSGMGISFNIYYASNGRGDSETFEIPFYQPVTIPFKN